MRCIFKCVTDGKQCVLLTPTTVLAQQHWRTIRDRFAPYSVKVGPLNRFRAAMERRELLQQLAAGSLTVVTGAHQLLGRGTVFKGLSLVVDVLHPQRHPHLGTLYISPSSMGEMSLITTHCAGPSKPTCCHG